MTPFIYKPHLVKMSTKKGVKITKNLRFMDDPEVSSQINIETYYDPKWVNRSFTIYICKLGIGLTVL